MIYVHIRLTHNANNQNAMMRQLTIYQPEVANFEPYLLGTVPDQAIKRT
jgi:hypothetical protein